MGQNQLSFKGWDWSELATLTGREYKDYADDEDAAKAIREVLLTAAFDKCGKGDANVAAAVRRFLLALEHDSWAGYSKPFYKGIREVEHDGMMLQIVSHFLEYLWT